MNKAPAFTETQRLLLNVILAEPKQAVQSWERWDALTDWNHQMIDLGSFRLLPLVYRRLYTIAPNLEAVPKLKGLYRRSWYENTRLFELARPGLNALVQAGHPILLLKGVSLSIHYYCDRGARSYRDVDVLVPEKQTFEALGLLENLGWRSSYSEFSGREILERHNAVNLDHPSGGKIDLHRYLIHFNLAKGIDLPVWERAIPLEVEGLPAKGLSPADEILQTCLHGTLWNVIPSIRWIADAGIIIRKAGNNLDWDCLVSEAQRREVSLRTSKALTCLAEEFELDIPPAVLGKLAQGPFAWFEAAEAKRVTSFPGWIPNFLYRAPFSYYRSAGPPDGLSWWVGLVRYLIFFRKPPSLWQFPRWLIRRWQAKRQAVVQSKTR